MKSAYLQFLKRLLLFSIILAIISFILYYLLPQKLFTPTLPYLFPFFISVGLLVHYFLLRAMEKKPARFITFFMAAVFLKMVFYLIVMVLYAFSFKEDAVRFMITYFILYVCYTVFEVIELMSFMKSSQKIKKETPAGKNITGP